MHFSQRTSLLAAALVASASTAAAFSVQMQYKHSYVATSGYVKQSWPAPFSNTLGGKGPVPVGSYTNVASAPPADMLNVLGDPFRADPAITVSKPAATSDISNEEVRALFELWNDALQTGSSTIVASRYSSDPILLPTVSDVPRTNFASIKDYFDLFLTKKPSGEIIEGKITKGDGWCQDAGIYEFTMGIDGSKVKGRYTFVYVFEDGEWKINHHHSSIMPEGISVATPITKERVRNLFQLWNSALATGDSTEVANRYSNEAVLLPTVSDTPRTTDALIKDYFDSFLLKKPQGEILSGDIMIGTNWAQDAGIYEFTMGIDGSKVKGRYTFVYVFEDGEWKISQHHSSVMPEAYLAAGPAPAVEEAVEA